MSMFMPDGPNQTQPSSGVADITPANPETTSADIALMQRVLSAASRNPNLIPADFMAYVLDWIQTQRLTIPIGQVFGFSQFTVQPSTEIDTSETTTSGTYADLATVGPKLTGMSDGKYLFLFGCTITSSSAGTSAYMGIEVNGTAPAAATQLISSSANTLQAVRASVATLADGGANAVTAKYKTDLGVTGTFGNRWLYAIKYANS